MVCLAVSGKPSASVQTPPRLSDSRVRTRPLSSGAAEHCPVAMARVVLVGSVDARLPGMRARRERKRRDERVASREAPPEANHRVRASVLTNGGRVYD
eukprot:scaffold174308_cov32-Tisochrysis_lutea.AAC.2